jgi:pyridoxamine 5'-phosphate oxidase
VTADPFSIFSDWYEEAQHGALSDPSAVALACADKQGHPSVRMVLYRGFREGGFSFFTNYESRKGIELSENPFAAMVFYWAHLGKQVRLEGRTERLSSSESDLYFGQRPFDSQVTASVSLQSRPMPDEAEFLARLKGFEAAHKQGPIARPEYWGGFKLIPTRYEFWTHEEHRRHRRVVFDKDGPEWNESRLYP